MGRHVPCMVAQTCHAQRYIQRRSKNKKTTYLPPPPNALEFIQVVHGKSQSTIEGGEIGRLRFSSWGSRREGEKEVVEYRYIGRREEF